MHSAWSPSHTRSCDPAKLLLRMSIDVPRRGHDIAVRLNSTRDAPADIALLVSVGNESYWQSTESAMPLTKRILAN